MLQCQENAFFVSLLRIDASSSRPSLLRLVYVTSFPPPLSCVTLKYRLGIVTAIEWEWVV